MNNLDLNGDGKVDYIRVVDTTDPAEKDAHAVVLRVPISKEESQDVAVIGVERTGAESAVVQIKGDEALYGPDVIVEPTAEQAAKGKGHGPNAPEAPAFVVVNVWGWPCVSWFWGPAYVLWDSPWYWGYYPPYWHPWRPIVWRTWWGWNTHYGPYYGRAHVDRVVVANRIYAPRRTYSHTVVEQRPRMAQPRAARHEQVRMGKGDRPAREGGRMGALREGHPGGGRRGGGRR